MTLDALSRALKAHYSCEPTDLIPKDALKLMRFCRTFAQAVSESTTGRVRRASWSRDYHNCSEVWLHYLRVGELDKTCDDWIPERPSTRGPFTFPLLFGLTSR